MPFYMFDSTMLLVIPGLLLAMWAQMKIKSTFKKWSKVPSSKGLSGAQIARSILDANGLNTVPVKPAAGKLTDNYNPINKTLNLSQPVYSSTSVAAIGVAAHEVGHAIQHKRMYIPLKIRNGIFPIANIGSWLAYPLFFIGLFMRQPALLRLGIYVFSGFVVFTLITLPVELNASKRAVRILASTGMLNQQELIGAKKVLSAAALTYVASALTALLTLARFLLLSGNRD